MASVAATAVELSLFGTMTSSPPSQPVMAESVGPPDSAPGSARCPAGFDRAKVQQPHLTCSNVAVNVLLPAATRATFVYAVIPSSAGVNDAFTPSAARSLLAHGVVTVTVTLR